MWMSIRRAVFCSDYWEEVAYLGDARTSVQAEGWLRLQQTSIVTPLINRKELTSQCDLVRCPSLEPLDAWASLCRGNSTILSSVSQFQGTYFNHDFTLGMNITVWLLVNLRNRGHHGASCAANSLGRGSFFEMNSMPRLNGQQACMTMRGTTACSSYHLNCSLLISNTIWSARDFGFWSCDIKLAVCLLSGQSEAPTVQLWGLS